MVLYDFLIISTKIEGFYLFLPYLNLKFLSQRPTTDWLNVSFTHFSKPEDIEKTVEEEPDSIKKAQKNLKGIRGIFTPALIGCLHCG